MNIAVFIMGAVQTALLTLVPVMMEKTQISAVHWSWLLSAGLFLFVICSPFWGKAIDKFGAKTTLVVSFASMLVSHCLLVATVGYEGLTNYPWLLMALLIVARVGYGLSASGVFPSAQTWTLQSQSGDQSTASALAKLNAVSQLGRLSGPLLVSLVLMFFTEPLISVWILLAVGLVWTLRVVWNARSERPQLGNVTSTSIGKSDKHIDASLVNANLGSYRWTDGFSVYGLAITLTIFIGALQFLLGPYLQMLWQISASQASVELGWMLTTAAIISVLVALKIGPKLFRSEIKTVSAIMILLALGCALLLMADQRLVLHVAVACLSASIALATPWYGALLRDQWIEDQGKISGQLAAVHMAGYGVGTLVGGYGLQFFEQNVILIFALLPVFALIWFLLIKNTFSKLRENKMTGENNPI